MNTKIDTKNEEITKKILDNFKLLNTVPRGSGNERAVSSLMMDLAKELGLKCERDSSNNVIIFKPAQKTMDNRPVILQAHLDMVCAVDGAHKDYDFLHNPIYQKVEYSMNGQPIMTGRGTRNENGNWVPVDKIRTTLGADDGIGDATVMMILKDKEITHPPIIAIFTTGEETGMTGAREIDKNMVQRVCGDLDLSAARLINVDEEQDGRFCYGCAGGIGIDLTMSCSREEDYTPSMYQAFTLTVKGLLGGHSGVEIGERHANAIQLIGRFLQAFLHNDSLALKLFDINGGNAENAIASEVTCTIAVLKEKKQELEEIFQTVRDRLLGQYKEIETNMQLLLDSVNDLVDESKLYPVTRENLRNIADMIYLVPNDVLGFLDCDGYSVVETSSNMGIIRIKDDVLKIESSARSFYDARRDFVVDQIKRMGELFDFKVETHDAYSGWAQSPDSKLRKVFVDSYTSLFPGDPVLGRSIHAGLECGVFVEIFGDIDMIACGPTIRDVHTPKETLYLDTVPKTGMLLVEVLKRLASDTLTTNQV